MDYFMGLDLGRYTDFCALSVMSREMAIDSLTGLPVRDHRGDQKYFWQIRGLRRWPLRTPYTEVIRRVVQIATRPDINPAPRVVVDHSGVGTAVLDQVRHALAPYQDIEVWGISITAGDTWKMSGFRTINVAKTQITSSLAEALGCERVYICPRADGSKMENQEILERELAAFKIRVSKTGYQSVEAMGSDHDDCVIAVSMPLWLGSQRFCHMRTWGAINSTDVYLGPREQIAIDAEQARIEQLELLALQLERDSRNLHTEKQQARDKRRAQEAEACIDSDEFWEHGGIPRHDHPVYFIIATDQPRKLNARLVASGAAVDVIFKANTGEPIERRGGIVCECFGHPAFARRIIAGNALGEIVATFDRLEEI